MLHTVNFDEILNINSIFSVDSKYVNFIIKYYIFLFVFNFYCVITPQLKIHVVSVIPITFSIRNHLKQKLYGALEDIDLYIL